MPDFKPLHLVSTAFDEEGWIPLAYTCDGEDRNPPIQIDGIPENTRSLAIIVLDPDAPSGNFCHWVIWNIPATHFINEPEKRGTVGMNDFGKHRYSGPCPPSGTHHYIFKLYALDSTLDLPVSANHVNLESAISGHILAFGSLTGKYKCAKIVDRHRM